MGNSATRRKAAVVRQKQIREKVPRLALTMEDNPRFIADVMLGRLAKWLRIAGFDVLYSNRFSDDELIEISGRDGRILLSRDTRLLVRKPVRKFIFLESQSIQAQIRQVFETLHIVSLSSLLTRCLACNDALVETPREAARGTVPAFVYKTQPQFKSCPRCGKIYWAGTHRTSAVRTLEKLLEKNSEARIQNSEAPFSGF